MLRRRLPAPTSRGPPAPGIARASCCPAGGRPSHGVHGAEPLVGSPAGRTNWRACPQWLAQRRTGWPRRGPCHARLMSDAALAASPRRARVDAWLSEWLPRRGRAGAAGPPTREGERRRGASWGSMWSHDGSPLVPSGQVEASRREFAPTAINPLPSYNILLRLRHRNANRSPNGVG